MQNFNSTFGMNGNPSNIARDGVMGYSLAGTWGVGFRIKDISFIDDLKHTIRFNMYRGTNDASAIKKNFDNGFSINKNPGNNLTTDESAYEFSLGTIYKIYENLKVSTDISYIAMNYDSDMHKYRKQYGQGDKGDAWNINVTFIYNF